MKRKLLYINLAIAAVLGLGVNRSCEAQLSMMDDPSMFRISITKDTVKNIREDVFNTVWIRPDNTDSLVLNFDTLKRHSMYKINVYGIKNKFYLILLHNEEVMRIKLCKHPYSRFYLDKLVFRPGTYQLNVSKLEWYDPIPMSPSNWDDIKVCEFSQ